MKDGESLSRRQIGLKTITIGEFKQIIKRSKLPDDAPMFVDYPKGWSGIFQVYKQDGGLYVLASDNEDDSGIGGGHVVIDTLLWESDGLIK